MNGNELVARILKDEGVTWMSCYPSNPLSGGRYNYQEEQLFVPNFVMVDFQKMLATVGEIPSTEQHPSEWEGEPYFNEAGVRGADPDSHTTNALMEMGR